MYEIYGIEHSNVDDGSARPAVEVQDKRYLWLGKQELTSSEHVPQALVRNRRHTAGLFIICSTRYSVTKVKLPTLLDCLM